ncbi:MAG: YceD family protein [Betaproteobacteria bacterium]
MRVNVGRISRDKGACLEFAVEERIGPLEAPGGSVVFTRPVSVSGTVTNTGKCFVVQGTIATDAELVCDRCLEKFRRELEVPFEAEFFRQGHESGGGRWGEGRDSLRQEEKAFLADNGYLFRGEDLELAEAVREELSLALPMRKLCRENCAGLCPECGVNLNVTQCACERHVPDPRLAALQEWLNRENSGREV